MSESCAVEVYENESFHRLKGWIPHPETPFVMKANFAPCKPLDEITVPSNEWQWSTNWKINKMPGVTDQDGWEYASRFSRFKSQNRQPKSEAVWSRARRRLWIRVMRREAMVKNVDISKVTQKVQLGLGSIHAARLKIEEIMRQAPEAAESDQMRSLVTSVNRNIVEILTIIENAEKQCQQNQEQLANDEKNKANSFLSNPNGLRNSATNSNGEPLTVANTPAVLKKLKNDVLKEQAAIERALDPSIVAMNEPPSSSSSTSSSATPNKMMMTGRDRAGSERNINGIPITRGGNRGNGSFSQNGGVGVASSASSSFTVGSYQGNNGYLQQRPSITQKGSMSDRGGGAGRGSMAERRSVIDGDISSGSFSGNNNSSNNNNDQDLFAGRPSTSNSNSSKKNEVKSGSAGAFNPSLFVNKTHHMNSIKLTENDEIEDGVFVDRSTQDMIISSKLVPIDEVTVMQEIIDERHTEIEKIHKGLVEVNNLFNDLSKLVKEQEVEINTIYGNVDESHQKTKEAFAHIIEANRLHQSGNCIIS